MTDQKKAAYQFFCGVPRIWKRPGDCAGISACGDARGDFLRVTAQHLDAAEKRLVCRIGDGRKGRIGRKGQAKSPFPTATPGRDPASERAVPPH